MSVLSVLRISISPLWPRAAHHWRSEQHPVPGHHAAMALAHAILAGHTATARHVDLARDVVLARRENLRAWRRYVVLGLGALSLGALGIERRGNGDPGNQSGCSDECFERSAHVDFSFVAAGRTPLAVRTTPLDPILVAP